MSTDESELILIVDDEPRNLQVLGSFLQRYGYRIAVAQNGKQAIEFVEKTTPNIMLVDIMMPEMDGFEVCRRVKEMEHTREIPVLFITALTDKDSIIKGFHSGGSDYINKPIEQEEVLARVRVHLENRRLVRQLSETNRDLLNLNQLKNKFLGMAAHDLRNPLGSIMGYTELILEGDFGPLHEEQAPILERVYSASERMLNLVNNLLDVSVIESGKLILDPIVSSLKNLIEERVKLLDVVAAKKDISLRTSFQTDAESIFDVERISQVIDNLIGNAIKFSSANSGVDISVSQKGDQMMIRVSDSGPGIDQEEQKKIFGEFQQLSAKATAGERGAGLGLTISKKIVDAHHGEIRVESKLGQGSVFIVTLPTLLPQA